MARRMLAGKRLGQSRGREPRQRKESRSRTHQVTRKRAHSKGSCTGRNRRAVDPLKKSPGDLGGRGRMTRTPDRQHISNLVEHARSAGARLADTAEALGISERTLRRWRAAEAAGNSDDQRVHAVRPKPANALSEQPYLPG